MLTHLPNEILIEIFHQLHQDDQMECRFVCHCLNRIIEDFILYRTVFMYSAVNTKNLIKKVQQKPEIANKIEKIMINIDSEEDEQLNPSGGELLSLLSNLKTLRYFMKNALKDGRIQYPWHSQIKYISEESCYPTYRRFLSLTTCPRLTTLRISCAMFHHYSIFKNAPALTSLTIEHTFACFRDFEVMHESLPLLKSLDILDLVYLDISQSEKNITPATSVTDLMVNLCMIYGDINVFVDFLVYIYKKYPNLTTFKYNNGTEYFTFDEKKNISHVGWNPLFQKVGPQLKKLRFDLSSYSEDLIGILDKFDCKVNYLNLGHLTYGMLLKMAHSQQIYHIQTLVLENAKCKAFDWLKELHVLKKLKLVHCAFDALSNNIQMNCILDNAPSTLESLSLERNTLVINPGYSVTSNIKSLSFNTMKLHNKADVFICQCFPLLSKLKIKYCTLLGKTFNLETMDLLAFHYVEHYFEYSRKPILIKTHKNNEQRLYFLNHYRSKASLMTTDEAFYPQNYLPVKSYFASEMIGTVPGFTLVCNSVGKIAFI